MGRLLPCNPPERRIWSRLTGRALAYSLVFLGPCYPGATWGAQDPLVDLDAEIQAIKSEVLAVSVVLPVATSPAVAGDLGNLLDPARDDVDRRDYFAAIRLLQQQEAQGLLTPGPSLRPIWCYEKHWTFKQNAHAS